MLGEPSSRWSFVVRRLARRGSARSTGCPGPGCQVNRAVGSDRQRGAQLLLQRRLTIFGKLQQERRSGAGAGLEGGPVISEIAKDGVGLNIDNLYRMQSSALEQ